jgi:hypothetical protein
VAALAPLAVRRRGAAQHDPEPVRRFCRPAALAAIGLLALTLGFRLDAPPPEPVSLEARVEDTAVPLVRVPDTALAMPSPGAPLVVQPGGAFWIDMVVRIPLTPPPGVQQERALNDFAAVATGMVDVGERPVVPLPVTKIRPGGAQATHYRAVVEVPGWMPEGVWDLAVTGRGFDAHAGRALVVRRGAIGVVTTTAEELLLPDRARAAVLSGALVALVPAGIAASAPPDEAHARFVAALDGAGLATVVRPSHADRAGRGASFRRLVAPLSVRGPAIADGAWTEPASARAVTVGDVAQVDDAVVNRGSTAARVVLRVSSAEPSYLSADGRRLAPRTVDLAGTLDQPTVLRTYELDLPPFARRVLRLEPAPASPSDVALEVPRRVDVGDAVTLRPRDPGPRPSSTAWSFDDESFAAGERVRHRFTRLGRHDVLVVRVGPDGAVARGRARVRVDTAVRRGCATAGSPGASILPAAALLWLISALARRGNPSRRPNVRSIT